MNKVVKKAEVAATKKKPVKTSKVKVRHVKDTRPFFSKEGTQPLNDVVNAKGELIKGLTVDQKIAEGLQPRFKVNISFQKTKEEKEKLAKEKSKQKFGRWAPPSATELPTHTLIVHLKNITGESTFKTTHSFKDVSINEVGTILNVFFLNKKDENKQSVNQIDSYYYKGIRVNVKND